MPELPPFQPPPPPPPPADALVIEPPGPSRDLAMWTHLVPLICTVTTGGVLALAGSLVAWLVWRDRSPFIDDHGRESVNFHISFLLWFALFFLAGFLTCGIGWYVGLPLLYVYAVVTMILAALAAQKGKPYRYPACFRFV